MPGVDVAYRDYTWSRDNTMRSTFAITLLFAMALPQKKRKSHDMNFKLKAVEAAGKKSKEEAAREFFVECVNERRASIKHLPLINAGSVGS